MRPIARPAKICRARSRGVAQGATRLKSVRVVEAPNRDGDDTPTYVSWYGNRPAYVWLKADTGALDIMKTRFAFCAAVVVLASSFAMAQQVSVNYNHDAIFSQYHTYAWGSNNTNAIKNSILASVSTNAVGTWRCPVTAP